MQNYIGYEHNKPSFLCAHNRRYPEAKTNPRPNAIFSICFSALCLYFHWRLHRTQCGCSVRFQCHFITPITPGNHIVRQVLACQHLQSGPAGRCTPWSDFSTNLTEKQDSDCEFSIKSFSERDNFFLIIQSEQKFIVSPRSCYFVKSQLFLK